MDNAKTVFCLEKITKIYKTKNNVLKALDSVSLEIIAGEIFGIIGTSGAGKSTLVRTLNRLEEPDSGKVFYNGFDLAGLSERELNLVRRSIGMIFQDFNLLMQKTVIENVMLPMRIAGLPKKQQRKRALETLEIVGLLEKMNVYPSQLSGGQKQRVAIARAISMNPKVLLCDEATSALDPQTTKEILSLIKSINKKLGITIVIITHQMSIVESVCNRVAVIDNGILQEEGKVEHIFTNPTSEAGRRLVYPESKNIMHFDKTDQRCVRIAFEGHSASEPIIANLVRETGEAVNILCADTKSINGMAMGQMIIELPKSSEGAQTVIDYFVKTGVYIAEETGKKVSEI